MAALCCVGGAFSIDKDEPYQLDDRYVHSVTSSLQVYCVLTVTCTRRVDWLGAFLGTSGLILIVFAQSDGNVAPAGWKTGCESRFPRHTCCVRYI